MDIKDELLAEAAAVEAGRWLGDALPASLQVARGGCEKVRDYIAFEISTYALRNRLAHNGIRKFIDECRWQEFTEQTKNDLQFLHLAFN